jgi:hypothetical protein
MSRAFAILVAAILAAALSMSAAIAGPITGPLKWSQPPVQIGVVPDPVGNWPLYTGWDEPSWSNAVPPQGPRQAADDWACRDNLPVTDIHWWGSYLNWREPLPPLSPAGFWFGIYKDVPAPPTGGFSQPGELVWSWATTAYKEVFVGYDGRFNADGTPIIDDSTFQYNVDIPQALWFYQPGSNNILWLSIVALYPTGVNYEWGWKTRPHFFQDDAVRLVPGAVAWEPIYGPDGNSWDLAFELSTVPEPGSLTALGAGLVGLVGIVGRRMRRQGK